MTTRLTRIALATALAMIVQGGIAHAQARRGGMVGNRGGGGGANSGYRGSPSFSAPAARPAGNAPNRPANVNPGNMNRPAGGGMNRPNPGGNPGGRPNPGNRPGPGGEPGNRPGPGGNPGNRPGPGGNPGNRPGPGGNPGNRPGQGGIGDRPPFGGIGNNRPGPGGNPGNRPGPGTGPARPPQPGFPGNRPGPGGNGGQRPEGGLVGNRPGGGANRPGFGDNLGIANRPNIGNNVNRPINSGNTNNVNRPTNIGNNSGNTVVNRTGGGNTIVNRPTNINNSTTNVSVNHVNNVNTLNQMGYRGGAGYRGGYGYGGGYGAAGFRPNPYAAYHAGWVNGSWNGHYNSGWGWNNWGMNALGWGIGIGVASWGIGSMLNTWGYSSFVNPYYMPMTTVVQPSTVVVQPVVYDYSRPLDLSSPPPAQPIVDQAVASIDSARTTFQTGDYAQALKLANLAIQQTPNDPMLHQFRAICLFALGRYDEAAIPMYTVLSTGPGWDWTTMVSLYPDIEVYTQQLRALEAYSTTNPQAASARFLLAALYMTQGSNDAAAGMLKQVVALQPRDTLSAQLLATLTSGAAAEQPPAQPAAAQSPAAPAEAAAQPGGGAAPIPQPGEENAPNGPALPADPVPAKFVGSWTASPAKDVTISLSLAQDKGFTWKVTDRGQSRQFQGQATFDNDVLALAPADQPPMVGTVTWKDDAHFQFKAVGAPANDPGLVFSK